MSSQFQVLHSREETDVRAERVAREILPALRRGHPWTNSAIEGLRFLNRAVEEDATLPVPLLRELCKLLEMSRPTRATKGHLSSEESYLLGVLGGSRALPDEERVKVWDFIRREGLSKEWLTFLIDHGAGSLLWYKAVQEMPKHQGVRTALSRIPEARRDPVVRDSLFASSDPEILKNLLLDASAEDFRILLLRLARISPGGAADKLEGATSEQKDSLTLSDRARLLSSSSQELRLEVMRKSVRGAATQ